MLILIIMIMIVMTSYLIRNLDDSLHTVAKMIAAHRGVSLDKLIKDAIQGHCLMIAHKDGLTETVLQKLEGRKPKKPARS